MAAIPVQVNPGVTEDALVRTAASSDVDGDTIVNNGKTLVIFQNTHATVARNITIDSELCSFGFEHDVVITVPALGEVIAGPFSKSLYGATLTLTYDDEANVFVSPVAAS